MKNLILILILFLSTLIYSRGTIIKPQGEYIYIKTEDKKLIEFFDVSCQYAFRYIKDNEVIFLFKTREFEHIKN